MDNLRVFMSLRPNAVFKDGVVNPFSLETIAKTYIGSDLPTQDEMDAAWPIIQAQDADNEFNRTVDAELKEIDLASIRSLREYIASKSDAPQWLKDQENAATAARETRKP